MDRPIIALSMGDPNGIGAELIVKVLGQASVWDRCRPVVLGSVDVLHQMRDVLDINLRFRVVGRVSEAKFQRPTVDVLSPPDLSVEGVTWGQLDPAMGEAAASCLRQAYRLAMADEVHGVVLAPMNKEAFHLAGYDYLDELAYLADFTGSADTFMLGAMDWVWTVPVTEHIAFRDIADLVTKDRVLRYIDRIHTVLSRVKGGEPKIGVAALNVHGGEGGLFGWEEIREIRPAVEEARQRGIDVQGPFPADTVFVRAREEGLDGVVCMYHDQANIVRKLAGTRRGATVFMGLPVVCATTAHGTAFDRAGKGVADPGSLEDAINYTIMLSARGT